MATRTISNAGGLWSATTAWVEGAVPTAADDVVATATSGDLHHNVNGQACRSIDFTNYVGTFTFDSGQGPLQVGDASGGDVKLVAGMTVSYLAGGGGWTLKATTGGTVKFTSAGKSVGLLNVSVGATTTVQLQDDVVSTFTTAAQLFTLTTGKLDTQGFDLTLPGLVMTAGFAGVTLGDSVITITNATTNQAWVSATSCVYATNTATILCSAASPTLNPSSSNYNGSTFKFTGGGTVTMNGGLNTNVNILVDSSAPQTTIKFPTAQAWSLVNLSVTGTSGSHHAITSGTTGTQAPLVVTGTVSVSFCDFTDVVITGSSAPIPVDAGSIDNGNNQGVKFTKPYVAQAKKVGSASVSSLGLALTNNVTAGNTIIVGIQTATRLVSTVTDSLGNTYTPLFQKTAPIGELWYCPNVLGGANTVTVTVAGGTDAGLGISIMEIGGVAAAPLDKSVLADGTSTSPSSGASATTTVADEIVIGWMAANTTSGTPTQGTGYKNLTFNTQTTGAQALEQKTVASTGAQTATFGIGASVAWHAAVITFKAASGSNVTGAAAMGITVGRTTAGKLTAFSASAYALTLNRTTSGVRTRLGSITYALVLARTTAGLLTAKGSFTLPIVLSRVTAGAVAGGQVLRPDADLAAGSWVTAPLWSKVDEAVAAGDVISATSS